MVVPWPLQVPLIPARGATVRWALKRCRRPDSPLLWELGLQPSDLEMVGLALPTEEFLRTWKCWEGEWWVGWWMMMDGGWLDGWMMLDG